MATKEKEGFEEMLRELERLVSEMETGALELDALMAKFEEGKKLAARCAERLEGIKGRISGLGVSG